MIIVVMGVSGVGKSLIGQKLAARLGWTFVDADSFHSPQAIAQMRAGIPLTDRDRQPWLVALHQAVLEWQAAGDNVVLACSALKQRYREMIQGQVPVEWVYLRADPDLIRTRLQQRQGHFMAADLLASQLATLEEPQDAVVVEAENSVAAIVTAITQHLKLEPSS